MTDTSYERAVSAWAAHLRAGGTTPWSAWVEKPTGSGTAPVRPLPDAIHLELVRQINLAGPDSPDLAGLTDRVLATASPGRGLIDVPMPWPDGGPRFGTAPVDPDRLPVEELVRLASGVIAHLLPDVPPSPPQELPRPRALPWRRRFFVHGAPETAAAVRRSLLAQGWVESNRRSTHIAIGLPVDLLLAEHWASNVRSGGILKWRNVWRRSHVAGRLPRSLDVPAIAGRLHSAGNQVHVVVAQDPGAALVLTAQALGTAPADPGTPTDLARCDLLRRVNRLTAMTEGADQVARLAAVLHETLDDLVRSGDAAGTRVLAPADELPWASEVAARMAEELREAGYSVHGDPEAMAPTQHRLPGTVDRNRTLGLAVAGCLRLWAARQGQLREAGAHDERGRP
jgi:hypothetical protein